MQTVSTIGNNTLKQQIDFKEKPANHCRFMRFYSLYLGIRIFD